MNKLDYIAQEYHLNKTIPDMHIENIGQEYFIRWLSCHITPGMRVLELGYGDGIVTQALLKAGVELTILEGASELVKVARKEHPELNCLHTLFESYTPEPDQEFDLVIASHVLEHVDDPALLLQHIYQWLTNGGQLIAAVPNKNSVHRQLAVLMGLQPELDSLSNRDLIVGHQRVFSLQSLEQLIRSANFEIKDSAGFFLKVLPNSMMLDYSMELLRALNSISPAMPKELLANIAVVAKKP
jgi:2-polyprenyl-3-methyl-5-hydroxy-6-metoxy-1,4-benzoquinol methylase